MKEAKGRKVVQWLMAPLLPLVVIGGYYWPYLGYVVLLSMVVMLVLVWFRGRYFCGWLCAMGAFYERLLAKVSLNRPMVPVLKAAWFRWLVFAMMMGLLLSRLLLSGGEPRQIGAVFVMMWTISASLAVALGLFWKPRSWCSICPMGTMQGLLAPAATRIRVADSCKQCGLCARACPIETNPAAFRGASVPGGECMRCLNCVANCPQGALSLLANSAAPLSHPAPRSGQASIFPAPARGERNG